MGVAGMVIGTLAMGYMQGKAQQDQYNAMAAQSEANARIADMNASKAEAAAKEQDRNNKYNEEIQHRERLRQIGSQRAAIGASGITASGSALNALADSRSAIEQDMDVLSYNNRQNVQKLFDQSTDYVNNRDQLNKTASNYRAAGRQAMTNAMLGSVFSLATSLYTPKSAASQAAGVGSSSGGIGGYTASWAQSNVNKYSNKFSSVSGPNAYGFNYS